MIDFGENRAEERKGECNTADIGTKAVTAEVLRRRRRRWDVALDVFHPRFVQCLGNDGFANLEDANSEIAKQELWSRELRIL